MSNEGKQPSVYREPARNVPVLGQWDVLVCGGGPAGCAAAIAAVRHGAKVLLIEKDGYLGGAIVSQLVVNIHSTNGVDFQGIWHEYLHALRQRNAITPMHGSVQNVHIGATVDPELVKYVWDELLEQAGVQQLLHAHATRAILEGGRIVGVLAETRAGRQAIYARRVIDCTGDAMVCHQAGAQWDQGADGKPWAMACTRVFRMGNVQLPDGQMTEQMHQQGRERLERAIAAGEIRGPIAAMKDRLLGYLRGWSYRTMMAPTRREEFRCVLTRILKVDPLDPWDFTRAEREGRAQALEAACALQRCFPGLEEAYMIDTSNHLGLRSSRRVRGLATVTAEDAIGFGKYSDSIARSSWDIDVWPPESYTAPAVDRSSEAARQRRQRLAEGEYFDIRYGCLVVKGIDNLLMAGRCISAEHEAQSSLRIQQTCIATGQAAGTAAALSLRQNLTPRELDPMSVVGQLEHDRTAVEPATP